MTFNLDGAFLINLALLLAVLGFLWKLSRDVGNIEQRVNDKLDNFRTEFRQDFEKLRTEFRQDLEKLSARIDVLSQRVSALAERVARIEGRMEGRYTNGAPREEADTPAT